jgi:hypothetical protein
LELPGLLPQGEGDTRKGLLEITLQKDSAGKEGCYRSEGRLSVIPAGETGPAFKADPVFPIEYRGAAPAHFSFAWVSLARHGCAPFSIF